MTLEENISDLTRRLHDPHLRAASNAAKDWEAHNVKLVLAAFGTQIDWRMDSVKISQLQAEFEEEVHRFFFDQTSTSDRLREKWQAYYRSLIPRTGE